MEIKMSDLLDSAKEYAFCKGSGETSDDHAKVLAAIAQAEALEKIADALEKISNYVDRQGDHFHTG